MDNSNEKVLPPESHGIPMPGDPVSVRNSTEFINLKKQLDEIKSTAALARESKTGGLTSSRKPK